MRMRVITLPLLAKTVDPTHRATWRVHALASSWVFPNCIRRRSPSRLCVYWKWTNSKASCTPVDPYSLSLCHIVSIGMSNRHKSHVDACFLFLLRPSPSFPYFSKKITRLFFYVENVPIENFESNNGRYAFLISNHFCHHSFLFLFQVTFIWLFPLPFCLSTFVPPNCSPHLSLMTFHFPFASLLPHVCYLCRAGT
jgi:hypothetical protein